MAKAPKPKGRKPVATLVGSVAAPVDVEISISDPEYTVAAFSDDVKFKRVWTEGEADAQGWKKLVYSADGPTGDPWQIGKIRFAFNHAAIDQHFGNLTNLKVQLS